MLDGRFFSCGCRRLLYFGTCISFETVDPSQHTETFPKAGGPLGPVGSLNPLPQSESITSVVVMKVNCYETFGVVSLPSYPMAGRLDSSAVPSYTHCYYSCT